VRSSSLRDPYVSAEDLFCQGIEYEPHPLPKTAPQPTEVSIDLWFAHVARAMDLDETETFEKLTREYMRVNHILLESLTVTDQSVRFSKNMPGNVVVASHHRRLERPSLSLRVQVQIKAWNAEDILPVMEEDWSGYLSSLAIGLDFLEPRFITTKTQDWKLLGIALGLALAAASSVVVVRSTGRRRVEQHLANHKQPTSTPSITPNDIVSLESDGGWNSADSPSDGFHDVPLDSWRESKGERKVEGTLIYV